MRTITKRLALIAMIPATLLGMVLLAAAPAQAAPTSVVNLQNGINTLINQQRAAHGCKPLTVDAHLLTAARAHSAFMATTGKFSHTGRGSSTFDYRIKTAGYSKPSAENIAYGYRSAAEVVSGWMNSPGHRTNILNCQSTRVGVGAVYAANGTPYYTQDFGY
ncbi:hypothetical protein GCM10010172_64020 [Paractinoplanes ferrugineus]|uniref:SCP domain-containing protein n=1 Tax=Paractinoplanes ferrugineus TaxID=113564 RepID=A0A919IWI1_9ACTN|nr:CAP domain-containing protein [Actinoplanes ferrugineus]GIE09112.1 hypothetical protein Afe05nite_09520 [Actinoplanes ferrugineus]